jgi:tripartite ATP-independent transporter DctP family solute receptor
MKKVRSILWLAIGVLAVMIMLPLDSLAAPAYTIKLGHAVDPGENYAHLTCVWFKERVEKYTNGQVKVEIYPAGQLGDEPELVRSIQMGTVQAAFPAVNNFNVFAPSIGYYTLPYIFETVQQFRKITDAMWDQNNNWSIKESGCRMLSVCEVNFRQLSNSKRPITKLEDLKGLRIRVPQNKIMVEAFASFGVTPVAMAWGETFNALQQKVLDGQEVSYNLVRSQKFYEAQKYLTEISYIAHAGTLVIGEKFLQSLPKDFQESIIKAGKEAMALERDFSDKMFEDDIKFLKSKGMEVFGPPTDKPEWVKRAKATYPKVYSVVGGGNADVGKSIIDKIEQLKKTVK